MLRISLIPALVAGGLFCALATPALAQSSMTPTGFYQNYIAGDWSLTVGGAGIVAPSYEGAKDMALTGSPMISLSRTGVGPMFSSRNDNPGLALYDNGVFNIGPVGKILFTRDDSTSNDLRGLRSVPWGGELGLFADYYPLQWLRLRGEIRQGIRAHHGVVGDLSADAFYDLSPAWRISGGPRLSLASSSYYRAYYGVTPEESVLSGLDVYSPGGGVKSVGVGGALTWKTTDKITTSAFTEYSRLTGPAADSSLVKQRGSVNQILFGVSATYRFDFHL